MSKSGTRAPALDSKTKARIRTARAHGESTASVAQREGISIPTVIKYSATPSCRRKLLLHKLDQAVKDLILAQDMKTIVRGGVAGLLQKLQEKKLVLQPMELAKLTRAFQNLENAAFLTLAADLRKAEQQDDPHLVAHEQTLEARKSQPGRWNVPLTPDKLQERL